jgi:hypothetical protein
MDPSLSFVVLPGGSLGGWVSAVAAGMAGSEALAGGSGGGQTGSVAPCGMRRAGADGLRLLPVGLQLVPVPAATA